VYLAAHDGPATREGILAAAGVLRPPVTERSDLGHEVNLLEVCKPPEFACRGEDVSNRIGNSTPVAHRFSHRMPISERALIHEKESL